MKNIADVEFDGRVELSSVASRLGRTTVELYDISKTYGDRVLIKDFTYLCGKTDRVGFVGPNGCGKSTLMKIIMGEVAPDAGRVEIGQTVKIGYYAQEIGEDIMNPGQRVIDYIRDVAEYVETEEGRVTAARMLERFLFEGEDQYGLLGKLSGGERRRLYLCKVLMGAPNVLILDEPTNDLDIATLQILEDYLDRFQGIVLIVSHDRYFLDRTVNRIFSLEPGGNVVQHEGGYTDYVVRKQAEEDEAGGNVSAGEKNGKKGSSVSGNGDMDEKRGAGSKDWKIGRVKKLKMTYQEQRDYETIEGKIAELEQKLEQLEEEILKHSRDFVKLNELTAEKERTEALLEESMERWMYLEDLAARIEKGETV